MTVKEYLTQTYRIDRRINSKLEQVASLRELAAKATATLSDTPHKSNKNTSSMETIICKMIDLENEINSDIDTLIDLKRDIVAMIKRIQNPEYQTLLELRYLCFKTWEQIAVDMGYSLQYAFRIHEKALKCIEFLKEESKVDRKRVKMALK
ncbi:MAG: DUF1492 domain-containing protein [Peptococcaceae bacterium]|nr:DUF1492 domain-containing protein [Eubacteriales bacterium]MDH7526452.1 DUF1492 domain-containing protein [Peptococcaceae bacterium]